MSERNAAPAASVDSGRLIFTSDSLLVWAEDLLKTIGVPVSRARLVAESLVGAELCGLDSHGLSRLGIYVKRLKLGLINPSADLLTISETESTLVLDAQCGFGHPATAEAIDIATRKARVTGLCAVAIRNSTHFGRAAFFAERAAHNGCIAIVSTNSAARMAPWGGKEAVFGTNPLAVGVPCEPEPLILDMSTSVVALGKIIMAEKSGEPIPEGWALDRDGRPTTDAKLALEGTLLPMGGPKGSGLALMLDILSGVLSGARFGKSVGSLYRDFTKPEGCGHFAIVLDVAAFMPIEVFRRCVADYCAQIKSTDSVLAGRAVALPGEIERERRVRSLEDGIVLSQEVYRDLVKLSEAADVAFPRRQSS